MAGNTGAIDDVVRDKALQQLDDLTAKANLAEQNVVSLTKACIELNNATGNSKSFKDYNNNATAAALATSKLQKAQQDLARATVLLQQAEQRLAALTNQTAASQQVLTRQTILTQNAIDKKAASEAKAAASAQKALSPYQQLLAVYRDLTVQARDAGIEFGKNSYQFQEAAAQANGVRARLDEVDNTLGHSQRNVGNYASGFVGAFSKIYGGIRIAANIIPGLGISGIFLAAFEGLKLLVQQLDIFNSVLSEVEIRQQGFQKAISSSTEYKDAIKNVAELTTNLELAKEGFVDKNRVIDEYNDSIGKVTGKVDTLDQAEQGLVKNADKFIRATLLKAAAEIVLADAAKEAADTALKNQKLQDDIDDARNNRFTARGFLSGGFNAGNSQSQNIAERVAKDQKDIDDNNKKLAESYKNRLAVIKGFDKQQADLFKGSTGNTPSGTNPGVTNVDTLNNNLANLDEEQNKNAQNAIIENDKKSYSARLAATDSFYKSQKNILRNNFELALKDTTLSENQQLEIEKKFANDLLSVEQDEAKKRQDLASQALKDSIAVQQQRLATSKKDEQEIIADQKAALDDRLKAVKDYVNTATQAAKLSAKLELDDAGDNSDKRKAIELKLQGELSDIKKEGIDKTNQINKEANDALLKIFKEGEKQQAEILKNSLDVAEQFGSKRKTQIASDAEFALTSLSEQYAKGLITQRDYEQKKADITAQSTEETDQADIQRLQIRLAIELALNEDQTKDLEELEKAKRKLAKDTADAQISEDQRKRAEVKKGQDAEKAAIKSLGDELITLGKSVVDAQFTTQLNSIQTQKDALSDLTKSQIDAENRSLDSTQTKADKIAIINAKAAAQQEQLDQKARQIKQKQAQADRLFTIASIIENTAIAVSKALAEYIFPYSAIVAGLVGALGAAQIATVLATPIPKYQTGTDSAKGGLSIVGEAGKEYVLPPNGDGFFTPDSATLMDIPQGSKVIPHHKLGDYQELFSMMVNPFKPQHIGRSNDNRRVIDAINRGTDKTVRALRSNRPKAPVVIVDTLSVNKFQNKRNSHFK